jgi:hypothetical protein
VALYYEPILLAYSIGQMQILLNLLFTLGCLCVLFGRERANGVLMAICTAIKPQFGPLLLVELLLRRFRFAAGYVVTAGIVGVVSLVLYGWKSQIAYLSVLRFLSERGESFHLNESVNGILQRWLENGSAVEIVASQGILQSVIPPAHPTIAVVTRLTTLALLALPFVLIAPRRKHADPLLAFCLAAVLFVLASPIAWTHHYGVLLPMYLVAGRSLLRTGGLGFLIAFGVSFVLTALRWPEFREAEGVATLLQVPVFFGAIVLACVLARQLLVEARNKQHALAESEAATLRPTVA